MFNYLSSFCCQHKKAVIFSSILLVLFAFGDVLLYAIAHFLHVVLEFIELVLEEILEAVFGLSRRQSQILLFYGFWALLFRLSWYIGGKAYFVMLDFYQELPSYWQRIKKHPYFKTTVMLGAIGTTVYLFS